MDKNNETEEQLKERLRKEILEELNNENLKAEKEKEVAPSFSIPKKTNPVSFEPKLDEAANDDKVDSTVNNRDSKSSKLVLVICAVVVLIAIILFPTISNILSKQKSSSRRPSIDVEQPKEKEYEKITLESEVIGTLKYPIMHNDVTKKTNYYSKDKLTISDFSNNDILYNALVDVYEGNMAKYNGAYTGKYCGGTSKKVSLDARYLRMRIENLYTKKAKYSLTNFVVPANSKSTKYVGTWKYDKAKAKYIYYGNCGTTPTSMKLVVQIKMLKYMLIIMLLLQSLINKIIVMYFIKMPIIRDK